MRMGRKRIPKRATETAVGAFIQISHPADSESIGIKVQAYFCTDGIALLFARR